MKMYLGAEPVFEVEQREPHVQLLLLLAEGDGGERPPRHRARLLQLRRLQYEYNYYIIVYNQLTYIRLM